VVSIPAPDLVESDKWSRGVGINLRATDQLLLCLLPCVEWLLNWPRDRLAYQDSRTSGFPSRLSRLTILCDYTYLEWRTCIRKGINCFRWSIVGPDPASSAGESNEVKKGDGDSSRNLRMNRSLALFHRFLSL
jgi:hypothetical protein